LDLPRGESKSHIWATRIVNESNIGNILRQVNYFDHAISIDLREINKTIYKGSIGFQQAIDLEKFYAVGKFFCSLGKVFRKISIRVAYDQV
jgi:hypothetical protein